MNEPNIAVMENRLQFFESALHELTELVHSQERATNNLLETAKINQLRILALEQERSDEIKPKLNKLWDSRNEMKGGKATLTAIFMGGLALGTLLVEILKH